MNRLFQLLCLQFVISSLLFSQATGTLIGRVLDDEFRALPGANVVILELNTGTATDHNGQFRIMNIPVGVYEINVMFIGFVNQRDTVTIVPETTTELHVVLNPGVVQLDAVTVVGERLKGQAKALNQQKNNSTISNIVAADQIGRFPDQNIGDALKRIPALSVNYNQGEARYVNIRGTGPRLSSVTIDGERMPSADAETRAVQLDLIPADMIQSVEVHKTVTPNMDADAIGGTVNLVTRQVPYVRRLSATLGSGYNKLANKPMLNGALVVGQRFYDDRFGVVLSGSYDDFQLASHNTEGQWAYGEDGGIYPQEWDVRQYDIRRVRSSASAALDYRASDAHRFFLNLMYNHRDDWENRLRLRYRLEEPNKKGVSKDSEIRRQTKGGPNTDRNNNARLEDQRQTNVQLKGKHNFADALQLEWTLSQGRAWEKRPRERYIAWFVKDETVEVDLSNLRTPYFSDDVDYDDFEPEEISEEYRNTDERNTRFKMDFEMPLVKRGKYENELEFGFKVKSKTKIRDSRFDRVKLTDDGEELLKDMLDSETRDYSASDFLAGDYRIGRFTTYEYLGQLDFSDTTYFNPEPDLDKFIAANYSADERVASAFIMLDQDLGKRFELKAGLRMEETRFQYEGNAYNEEDKEAKPTQGQDHYINWLPGLHLKYELDDKTDLRFAYTNTLSRPDYYDLVPYRNISRNEEVLEIGNPYLRPTTSTNFDLMFERYDEHIGIFAVGVFTKDIDNFIYIHKELNYEDKLTGNTYDEFYEPRNGAEAVLWGAEVSLEKRLTFLPGKLANLRTLLNYTLIHSRANSPTFPQKNLSLPGAAPHTFNANLIYESRNWAAGLSFNYTSPYLDPDETDLTPGLERYYDTVTYLDFNASYSFSKHLQIFLEANNLLNQPLRYYAGTPARTYQQEFYDLRFTTGVKYDL